MQDLQPSEWFHKRHEEWVNLFQAWGAKQNEYQAALAKKVTDKSQKAALKKSAPTAKASAGKAEAKKRATPEGRKAQSAKKRFAGEAEEHEHEREQTEVADAEEDQGAKEDNSREEDSEMEEVEVNVDLVDPFGQADVCDIGGTLKQPLFSKFGFEDWTMMSLRFELNLLVHSFRRDVEDPDRIGIPADHLTFYYGKYFKKILNPNNYGVGTIKELIELVDDTVKISAKNQIVETHLPAQLESCNIFVMLTEEARRDRQRHLDLGHEDARLRIAQPLTSEVLAGGAATFAGIPTETQPPISLLGVVPSPPPQMPAVAVLGVVPSPPPQMPPVAVLGAVPSPPPQMPPLVAAGVPLPPGAAALQQLTRPAGPGGPLVPVGGNEAPGVSSAPALYCPPPMWHTLPRPSLNSWRSDGPL